MRKRNGKILLLLFVAVFMVLTYYKNPKRIDKRYTYAADDKIPFGTYVVRNRLPDLLPGTTVETVYKPLSDWLPKLDKATPCNLVMMAGRLDFGEVDVDLLLDFVSNGNTLFVAAADFSTSFLNELELEYTINTFWGQLDTSIRHTLVNPDLVNDTQLISKLPIARFFELPPQFGGAILGVAGDSEGIPEFIRIHYGSGEILIHLLPESFTNIHTLEYPGYSANCLAYLPQQPTYWDEYYKPYRLMDGSSEGGYDGNPMQFIRNNPALNLGWQILVLGAITAMLFFAKRKQRIIPVIRPPVNRGLEFIETVGDLYFENGDHSDLALKKLSYFYHYIRQKYGLNEQDPAFWEKLNLRLDVENKSLQELQTLCRRIGETRKAGKAELLKLNTLIEEFYTQTGKYPKHE